ncbi:MAG TPA: cytochrome c [Vicinamibacterales bacterium]
MSLVVIPQAQQPPGSVWEGVYTEAQAKRGQDQYAKACSLCHGAKLQGSDVAPSLSGVFLDTYPTVADLFERVRTTMPEDQPGQLAREVYADIVAHMFAVNKFPAGQLELGTNLEALQQIRIERVKP